MSKQAASAVGVRDDLSRVAAGGETAIVSALLEGRCALHSLPDLEVLAVLTELAERRRVVDAALVELIGEVRRREDESPAAESLPRKAGFRNLCELVQQSLGVRRAEARSFLTVAEATRSRMGVTGESISPRYPLVADAMAAGMLSLAQSAAITRGLDQALCEVDPRHVSVAELELVRSAQGVNPEDEAPAIPEALAVQAGAWVALLDPDGAEPRAERIADDRGVWLRRRADGAYAGKFVATPEQGELLLSVFDAVTSPRRTPRFSAASCGEPSAAGLGQDCTPGMSGVPGVGDPAGQGVPAGQGEHTSAHDSDDPDDRRRAYVDPRSVEQQRMDALEAILVAYAASADAPRAGGEAPTVVITTSIPGLLGEAAHPDEIPRLERTGESVPPSLVAKFLCDGHVRVALQDRHGETLRLGRKQRLFTPAQRRAIAARDRHCRAAGCTAPVRWCETHHATPWSEGGLTDTADGVLLCSFHHHEVHRGRLRLERTATGRWRSVPDAPPRRRATRRRI